MNKRTHLLIILVLIGFMLGSSIAPLGVKAETQKQEEPFESEEDKPRIPLDAEFPEWSEYEDVKLQDFEPQALTKKQYYGFPGLGLQPTDSEVSYYDGNLACLGSTYNGTERKNFIYPLHIPHGAQFKEFYYMYWNVVDKPTTPLRVVMLRTAVAQPNKMETLRVWDLNIQGQGFKLTSGNDMSHVLDTWFWNYWLVVEMPKGGVQQLICNIQYEYLIKPDWFFNAIPMVNQEP